MTIKVMSYNILNGGVGREQAILEVVQSVRPDILVLQEVYTPDLLQALGAALDVQPFFPASHKKRRVALLSRLPIRSASSRHPVIPIWRNVVEAEIEYQPDKLLYVFGVHPKADLAIVSEWWRQWEAKHILKWAGPYSDRLCLIAGDFNAIAPGDSIAMDRMPGCLRLRLWLQGNRAYPFSIGEYLASGFTDSFRYLNAGEAGFTLPPPHPNARLDYIFVSASLKACLKSCWVVREPPAADKASDHYPVVAEFGL
jgi:endonuclease/exonuclease/phosphatase family metal-dependent hydrolase